MITSRFVLPFAAVLFLGGCSTYNETTEQTSQNRRAGRVELVAAESVALAQKHKNDRDTVVFELDAASALRSLALARIPVAPMAAPPIQPEGPGPVFTALESPYDRAVKLFADADLQIDDYETKAKRSVSAGINSAVVNPAMTPFRGHVYDKVMTSTYQALNFLALGDTERARASLNKAYRRQQDGVTENSARIEREQEKLAAAKNGQLHEADSSKTVSGADLESAQNNPRVTDTLENLKSGLDNHTKAYADYVNPFTTFLDGLFMMTNSTDAQERERAAKELARAAAMEEENPFLREDASLAEELAKGGALPKMTYVIFESGEAPHQEELVIPVPFFLVSRELITAQVPISRLVYNDHCNPSLAVIAGETQKTTATVCDMDSVISRDFKNQIPSMWTDALLCASTKAILQYEINKNIDRSSGGGYGALFAKLAVAVTSAATTRADTRSWHGLPKTFSYARLATPKDRTVTVSTPDGQSAQITLPDTQIAVVYVKQTQPGTQLLVDNFKLL